MEQKRFARLVHLLDDPPVLGHDELLHVVLAEQGSGLEAQIVPKAAHAVDVAVLRQKLLPYSGEDVPHLPEHIQVEVLVVHLHVAQVLQAHQVLDHLEHPVAHAADGPHPLGHGLPQGLEVVGKGGEVQVLQLVPGVFLKVLPGLNDPLHMAAQSAAPR